ncbi:MULTISPECIES: HlyD family efflux transporter periplasmic adaptor subunit [Cyanophyceae]|uniref:HlyD family efflux transporter periplasmic adaptor subunit n=1 Tax=Cyanophyceae TaxID=3028117 RepID=UPI001681CE0A|nr:HlyD family efflux transporter periplasmic adaptor subunit [Trichocoleus sp. FACHB-40]MBD2002727.1 HlyD family efflux transporter periplasmic adaptor subunit [Trichocoleus sp. FACHB-40]
MPHTSNSHVPPQLNLEEGQNEGLPTQLLDSTNLSNGKSTHSDDWSYATEELLDTLPQTWTRGLLYFLVVFVAILLPWAMSYKVDETGTARGRLELKGDTVKREADIQESIAVVKVHAKEGDEVKTGQILVELDSKSVRDEIQQNQIKLEGQQNRLNQLELLKNQLAIALATQRQQNKAQELEKIAQVDQARQNFDALKAASNLQKEEKFAQVGQARQAVSYSTTAYNLADIRYTDARVEVQRYRKLYQQGAVAEIKVKEMEGLAKEKLQLRSQAQSDIKQAKLRLEEQQGNYQRTIRQVQADIEQAKLRLEEQQRGYQSLIEAGKLAVSKSEQQLNELETQIATLQSEITQMKTQANSLKEQLEKYAIRAPFDGTIFQLPITREGAVVQPKQLIAEIAPKGTRLVFKGQIPTSESESLRSGKLQKDVNLKFDEYPFQDYEVVKGKLSRISPDSKITQTTQGNITTYDLEIELAQHCIQPESKCIPFKSGQPATAEVIIRQRRIIDFILDPFKKLQKGDLKL